MMMMMMLLAVMLFTSSAGLVSGLDILSESNFKDPVVVRTHFQDVFHGMSKLMASSMKQTETIMKLTSSFNRFKKDTKKQLSRRDNKIAKLERSNAEKDKAIAALQQSMEKLMAVVKKLEISYGESVKNHTVVMETLQRAEQKIADKDSTVHHVARAMARKDVQMQQLRNQVVQMKSEARVVKRNMSATFRELREQHQLSSHWVLEYVRNNTIKDISIHNEVKRLQQGFQRLETAIHDVVNDQKTATTEEPSNSDMTDYPTPPIILPPEFYGSTDETKEDEKTNSQLGGPTYEREDTSDTMKNTRSNNRKHMRSADNFIQLPNN